ncbi:MAG: hypothetical protein U9R34_06935 [Nanoarchaeota archaeon]|nr:hypothetical protein [Nanoarchaeota archaeon]
MVSLKKIDKNIRNPNLFEKILLVLGIFFVMFGYAMIHKMAITSGILNWSFVQAVFLWLIIVILIILVAVVENVKEELKIIICKHGEEIRLLATMSGKKSANKKEVKK